MHKKRTPIAGLVSLLLLSCLGGGGLQLFAQEKKAADYSKEPFVVERVFTKAIFENDGKYTEESTARVHIQSQAGLQQFGILSFPYASATSTMEIGFVRVVKPDGRVLQTPAENILDMPAEITRQAPFYSDIKVSQVAVKGLEIGDILEFQNRTQVKTPLDPGHFWYAHNFFQDGIALEEKLEIRVPRDRYVKVQSPKLSPATAEEGAYRVYTWKTADLESNGKKHKSKSQEPEEPELPSVQLTTFRSWDEVGQWFQGLVAPRAAVTPEILSKANELTRSAKSDEEKTQAIYNFVSTKFRYIGVSLGIGRYQPHAAPEVLTNGYGDCKDKHTLLAALLAAENIKVYPALIKSGGKIDAEVPSPEQFDHIITVLPQQKGFLFLDSTPEVAPFGYLLESLRDQLALVVAEKDPAQLVRTPIDPPFKSFFNFQADGSLDDSGTLQSKMQMTFRGDAELIYRLLMRQTGQPKWNEAVQRVSQNLGFGGAVSDVTATSPEVTDRPFHIEYNYIRKDYSDWENKRIGPPFPPIFMADAPEETDKEAKPIKLGALGEELYQTTLKLPANADPRLPSPVNLVESFIEYHATYSVSNGVLHVERRLVVKEHEVNSAQFEAYRKFTKAVKDDASNLISVFGGASASEDTSGSREARALYMQGVDAWRKSDLPGAAEAFQRAVNQDPKYAMAWLWLGGADYFSGKQEQGIKEMKKALALDPGEAPDYKGLVGRIMFKSSDDQALDLWRELKKRDPNDADAAGNIGRILTRQKHYPEAIAELEAALEKKPNDSQLLFDLGQVLIKSGEKEKGAANLIKGAESDGRSFVLNNVAFALAEGNVRLEDALHYAEKAVGEAEQETSQLSLDKDLTLMDVRTMLSLAAYWDTLGWVHFRLNHFESAEKYLAASWSLMQNSETADHLGQAYEKDGKKHEAAVAYSRALSAPRPPAETRARLDALRPSGKYQAGEGPNPQTLQDMRTIKLGKLATKHVSAEFFVLFAPGPKVMGVKFISGADELRDAGKALAAAKFDVPFPDPGPAQIIRRGILDCESVLPYCLFVLFPPQDVNSVN